MRSFSLSELPAMSSQAQLGGGAFQGESRPIRSNKRRRTMPPAPSMDLREMVANRPPNPVVSHALVGREGLMNQPSPITITHTIGAPVAPPLHLNMRTAVKVPQRKLRIAEKAIGRGYDTFQKHYVAKINPGNYADEVYRVLNAVYQKLPNNYKASSRVSIGYDFAYDSQVDSKEEMADIIAKSKIKLTMGDRVAYNFELQEGGIYWNHGMTGLNDREEDSKSVVTSLEELISKGRQHLLNRVALEERYVSLHDSLSQDAEYNGLNAYRRPLHLHIAFQNMRYNRYEEIGAGILYLQNNFLISTEAPPGDCLLQCIKDQRVEGRDRLTLSIAEMRKMIDLHKTHISMDNLGLIESRLVWTTNDRKDARRNHANIILFDNRFNVRRLPEHVDGKNEHHAKYIYIAIINKHAWRFKEPKWAW